MGATAIPYVTRRWDPVRGCTPVSVGCRNCFASRFAIRHAGGPKVDGGLVVIREAGAYAGLVRSTSSGPRWTGEVRFSPEALDAPFHWRRPQRIAVCFGGDLFHPAVRPEWIDRILDVIAATPQHTYLALTKRAGLIEEKLYGVTPEHGCRPLGGGDYLPNLWLGVSVEDCLSLHQLVHLRAIPAAVRWVSFEPLLESLGDLTQFLDLCSYVCNHEQPYPSGHHPERPAFDWAVIGGRSDVGQAGFGATRRTAGAHPA